MAVPLGSGQAAYGAGVGPCGHDPEDDPSEVVVQTPIAALYFDPYDRVYTLNADLSLKAGAGPIQRAAHLMLPRGAIPAVAFSGLDVNAIRRATPARRVRIIEDELRLAWQSLLSTGQITMGKVTLDDTNPWSGRFYVEVTDRITKQTATLDGNA